LLASLDNRQTALRLEFPKHFEPFANSRNRERFKYLFKPAPSMKTLEPEEE